MSTVFNEVRNASTVPNAFDVIDVSSNSGSALQQLDRQLLATWLNFANGSYEYAGLVDADGNGIPETPFFSLLATIEAVRLDPDGHRGCAARAARHPPAHQRLVDARREGASRQGPLPAQPSLPGSGSSARTVVPWPLARDAEAASERLHPVGQPSQARSLAASAPPTPSSETSTTSRPSSRARSTRARLAEAYLATFASDSETT